MKKAKKFLFIFSTSLSAMSAYADNVSDRIYKFENDKVILCIEPYNLNEGDSYSCGSAKIVITKQECVDESDNGCHFSSVNFSGKPDIAMSNEEFELNMKKLYEDNFESIKNAIFKEESLIGNGKEEALEKLYGYFGYMYNTDVEY